MRPQSSGEDAMAADGHKVNQKAETVADIHRAGERRVTRHQRFVEVFTRQLGRPRTLYALLSLVGVWVGVNTLSSLRWDPPPFYWLQGLVGVFSLTTTTMVLITQMRWSRRAERRSQLELHMSLLADEKIAKLVGLLEELRRDLPSVTNRDDPQAAAMAQGTDAREVLDQLAKSLPDEDDMGGEGAPDPQSSPASR
jgi:uncharacterized membrane protein